MEKELTAVEWLIEQLPEDYISALPFEFVEKAKEMEKQQIIEAWECGSILDFSLDTNSLQYYNKTYGGEL